MVQKFEIDEAIKFIGTNEGKWNDSDEGRIASFNNDEGTYTVKSAGHLVYDVPEISMESVYTGVDKEVDTYLKSREASKQFKDSDVRVSGTKKEMMAYKGLINKDDLESIEKDAIMARTLIRKDKVIPKFNTNENIDKGVSGGTLFLKLELRRLIANNPPDTPEFRKIYVGLAEWFYEIFSEVITRKDFDKACNLFYEGAIRKSILIANPEIEPELQKQNEEWMEQALKADEYRENRDNLENKIKELLSSSGISNTWNKDIWKDNFPEQFNEWKYWSQLADLAYRYGWNKILPIEYKYLYNLYVREGEKKKSILTGQEITEGHLEYFEKAPDNELISNYSDTVKQELIEAVFGEKFYYFIKQRTSKSYVEKAYEEFTQEEYDKVYESRIKPIEERINKYKQDIEFLTDDSKTLKEKLTYAVDPNLGGMNGWFWTNNKRRTLGVMFRRGDIDDAIRLMNNIVEHPTSGYAKKIAGLEKELNDIKAIYFVRENNYSFLEKEEKERVKGKRTDLVINSGTPLSHIIRENGIAIYDSDFENDDSLKSFYKNILGITGVTFGISMKDDRRLAHAKHFATSIIDLAECLNMDVKEMVSIGGKTLGIKFGASGHGRALANYESQRVAINLTNSRGDGTVSHEMAHYLDNQIQEKFPKDRKTEKNHGLYGSFITDGAVNLSNQNIFSAMSVLMNFIKKGLKVDPYTLEVHKEINKEAPIYKKIEHLLPEFISSVVSTLVPITVKANKEGWKIGGKFDSIEQAIEHYKKQFPRFFNYNYYVENKTKTEKQFVALVNTFNLEEYTFHLDNNPKNQKERWYESGIYTSTAYYIKSKVFGKYWAYDWELMARSFELYVKTTMAKNNRSNNYLVSGENFSRPEGVYPYSVEAEIINIMIENLFEVVKKELNIKDFTPFREERESSFVELNDDDTEKRKVVEVEDLEIIEKEKNQEEEFEHAIKVIEGLIELLKKSISKFEQGGQVDSNLVINSLFTL